MFDKGQLGNLMRGVQEAQEKLEKAQQELANKMVTGDAGAGMVKVTVNCAIPPVVQKVEISDETIEEAKEDKSLLEDLVRSATNSALVKMQEEISSSMGSMGNPFGDMGGAFNSLMGKFMK